MRQVSPELAAAIEASERTTRLRLEVDWDADGFGGPDTIDDLTGRIGTTRLSRTLQSDVPDEVRTVDGTVVANLTADLVVGDDEDEQLQAIRYWSPFNAASPLPSSSRMNRTARASIEFQTSAGWQGVPRMQGLTRSLPVDIGQRRAQLGLIDRRQLLRSKVALPAVIADLTSFEVGPGGQTQAPGLESTWVASHVCALNGLHVAPPPRPGCRMYIPMHGSAFPHIADLVIGVGWCDYTSLDFEAHLPVTFTPGPFLLAAGPVPTGYLMEMSTTSTRNATDSANRIVSAAGRVTGRIEMWLRLDPAAPSSAEPARVRVYNSAHGSGEIAIEYRIDTAAGTWLLDLTSVSAGGPTNLVGPAPVRDGSWHFYGVHFDSSTGVATWAVDGNTTSTAFTPFTGAAWSTTTDEAYDVILDVEAGGSIAEVQITGGTAASDPWLPAIPWMAGAVIDRGYPLDGIADIEPQDSWQILTDLTAAGLGATWYDEDGTLQVASTARLVTAPAQEVQRTVTALGNIVDLAIADRADTVRNRISCPYQPVVAHLGGEMWRADTKIYLPRRGTKTIQVEFNGPFVQTPLINVGANTAYDGSGTDYTGFVTDSATYPTAKSAIITLTNTVGYDLWLVDTSGSPSIVAVGEWLEQTSGAVPPDFSDVADGEPEQPLQLGGSRWIQSWSVAAGVAMMVLCSLRREQRTLTKLTIPGDPRLQFYDRIQVQDSTGTGIDTPFWVTGVNEQYEGYLANLTARQAQPRFLAGSGLVGQDLVG